MHVPSSRHDLPWDVLLVGGAAGTGKTNISYHLARYFDIGITEIDDIHTALATLTTPEQQPILHYWETQPDAVTMSAKEILELHISVARVLQPALKAVIANHIEEKTPVVLEGDYLLPELLDSATFDANRVRAVFLYEPDEGQIVQNFLLREPEEGEQTGRARVSWLFGKWLKEACERCGVAALSARPWESLLERVVGELNL